MINLTCKRKSGQFHLNQFELFDSKDYRNGKSQISVFLQRRIEYRICGYFSSNLPSKAIYTKAFFLFVSYSHSCSGFNSRNQYFTAPIFFLPKPFLFILLTVPIFQYPTFFSIQFCSYKFAILFPYLQLQKMKKVISGLFLLGVALTGGLNIGLKSSGRKNTQNAYDLSCEGGMGKIKYYVDGIPSGVEFDGATIVIGNAAKSGSYTIKVKAVDQVGQVAQRLVTLSITESSGSSSNTGETQTVDQQSSTTQTQTQGQSQTNQLNSVNRLSNIITTYSSGTQTVNRQYVNTGKYPQANLPTGADLDVPNPNLLTIQTTQAERTIANRNPITVDDVTLRSASDRHQNAIKGITNLLKIIDQARANRDRAQKEILVYTQSYNQAVSIQRASQNDIIGGQNKLSQVISAINTLSGTADDLRAKINQAISRLDTLKKEKQTILDDVNSLEKSKAGLLDKLKGLNDQVGQKAKQQSDKTSQCQSISDELNNRSKQLDTAQRDLLNIDSNRNNLARDIKNKSALVDDLRNRLQQAQNDLADAKIKLSDLDSKKLTLPTKINDLKKQVENLQKRLKSCSDDADKLQKLINTLKGDNYAGLTNDINNLDAKIGINRSKASVIDTEIANSQGPLEDLKSKLTQATQDLTFIKNQKIQIQGKLRLLYQKGNDANNRVAFAKQNLDSIIKRFQDESRTVSDATLNLEKARAQQALARSGLEELISHYSDALPYAIVPNGNGVKPGTPFGNNPSGSALGDVKRNGDGAPGSFRINSWRNYLSSAYGAGVNPAIFGSVNELFPFNFNSRVMGNTAKGTKIVNGNGGDNSRNCNNVSSSNEEQFVASGVVVAVQQTGFDIETQDGDEYNIQVGPCTKLNANKSNFKVKPGQKAIAKGRKNNQNPYILTGEQITCLD